MKNSEVSDEELKDAKAFLVGSFPLRIDTMKKNKRVPASYGFLRSWG